VEARRVAHGLVPHTQAPSAGERALARARMAALYPLYALGEKLIYSKVRQVTGGRMRAAISGGGSLAPYLDDFFEIVGVPIMNGYGLTETSPVLAARRETHNVRGTVGLPMVNTELSLRQEDGSAAEPGKIAEIWARGPQVMQGYYKNPEATAKVLTDDGWFRTGDLGWLTATGDLVIAGRAKDTIVLSSGENVEPDPIEDVCRKSRLISQIVVVGQDQKTLGALVVPDYANLAEAIGLPTDTDPGELVRQEKAARAVKQSIYEVMSSSGLFKASEAVTKVHLLAEGFSEANGLMTSTMKIKRNKVAEKYQAEIAALFQ
jgi:long-chain acyl-CoA synthetase